MLAHPRVTLPPCKACKGGGGLAACYFAGVRSVSYDLEGKKGVVVQLDELGDESAGGGNVVVGSPLAERVKMGRLRSDFTVILNSPGTLEKLQMAVELARDVAGHVAAIHGRAQDLWHGGERQGAAKGTMC